MTKQEEGKKVGDIIAKAWADQDFKKRLLEDATTVLQEEGVLVPDGVEVRAVENTEKVFHLVIPPVQALNDDALQSIAGGLPFSKGFVQCFFGWLNGREHMLS